MKIFVAGTRGLPGVPGGVETHCQELYPRLVKLGVDVTLYRRSRYALENVERWRGVDIVTLYSPGAKSLEAIVHTFLAIFHARLNGSQLLHIHSIGPGLLVPLARLLGMRVIFTHHGEDYKRQKWGSFARVILKLGEYFGCKFSNQVIAISEPIAVAVKQKIGRDSNLIFNGVNLPEHESSEEFINLLGLERGKYILAVARLVPEKGLHDLLKAFEQLESGYQLVIAGESDHDSEYSKKLYTKAEKIDGVIMPGYVVGDRLRELYSHAGIFVLPSYHEGLPIVLLEALSYGLPTVVSDIRANVQVGLDRKHYFIAGDIDDLIRVMQRFLSKESWSAHDQQRAKSMVARRYDWEKIAEATLAVYNQVLA